MTSRAAELLALAILPVLILLDFLFYLLRLARLQSAGALVVRPKDTSMSLLSKYVFDPIKAALARAAQSSSPEVQAAAQAGQAAYNTAASAIQSASTQPLTPNSAAGLGNDLIKIGEDGVRNAIDGVVTAAVGGIPVVGVALTPEAVAAANLAIDFAESHFATYVASLFSHAKQQVATQAIPA